MMFVDVDAHQTRVWGRGIVRLLANGAPVNVSVPSQPSFVVLSTLPGFVRALRPRASGFGI